MPHLSKISEHVYWLPPGPPDRPSLCAVVGERRALMLDAGSSRAHTRVLLDALANEGAERPGAVVYTHSHWDHVLGGVELDGVVIAHESTAAQLLELAERDWSDDGLDRRVAAGLASPEHAAHVKEELPAPRRVEVAPADVVFHDALEIELGGVRVRVQHVGGDHSADSCVAYVEPDRVLFLGDCLCASSTGAMTSHMALPLADTILGFDAELYVEGHHDAVTPRAELEALIEKIRAAEHAARTGSAAAATDEDSTYFVAAFRQGLT
jgi:glyoxylase-like metal-dependent hydrolase (beta-lactamase superfamily II)